MTVLHLLALEHELAGELGPEQYAWLRGALARITEIVLTRPQE